MWNSVFVFLVHKVMGRRRDSARLNQFASRGCVLQCTGVDLNL
jgi:hypothetical protein